MIGGAFCVLIASVGAIWTSPLSAQAPGEVIVTRGVRIPMRTGAPLLARVFRAGGPPRPAILSLESDTTPARENRARALAAAGFAVVIAEPRKGDDKHVGRDGYDAIEWAGGEKWCDRHIVMEGTGEGANAAWDAAREHPPLLAAIFTRAPARSLDWSDQQFGSIAVPALMIAGALGEPQGSAVRTYERYARAEAFGSPRAAFLVIGKLDDDELVGLESGYFGWSLGRGAVPALLHGRVNYRTLHDGSWHSAETLDAIGAVATSYPLHTSVGPRATPVGFLGSGARDEEPADTLKSGSKTYETPLTAPLDLAGFPSVTMWVQSAPGAVATVTIEEVRPDGTVLTIGRSAGTEPRPDSVSASGPLRWEFSEFGWIATRLTAGSRLRLTVQGPPGVVIHHDTERYSRVILPVIRQK